MRFIDWLATRRWENRVTDAPQSGQAAAVGALPAAARVFAAFCFVLALLGILSFWPPRSPATVVWLLIWTLVNVITGTAIVRRARYAPRLVWSLIILAAYSAVSAFRGGLLGGGGILIDILLGIPLVWFAVWYQRYRRADSASTRPPRSSQ